MEINNNKKIVTVADEMVEITIKELTFNENDIEAMCAMFSDALLGCGYRFSDGHGIVYTKLEEE